MSGERRRERGGGRCMTEEGPEVRQGRGQGLARRGAGAREMRGRGV